MSLVQTEISALQVPIPNSFLEMQGGLGEKWQDERLFFVGYLARHVLREESEHSQTLYLNLQSQEMQKILGKSPKTKVIDPLREANVLEVNDRYSVGRFSKGYRLYSAYRQEVARGEYTMVPITGQAQLDRFVRWQERRHQKALERFPALEHQLSAADHFTVDEEGLEDFLVDLELRGVWRGTELTKGRHQYLTAQAQSMVAFFNGSQRYAHYASGRIHTPICNVPREFRRYILPKDGGSLFEVDLKSAQLVFLCIAIRSVLRQGQDQRHEPDLHEKVVADSFNLFANDVCTPSDVYPFMSMVLQDDIYTMFQEDYLQGNYTILNRAQRRLPSAERDIMKKKTFKDILFTPKAVHPSKDKGLRNLVWGEYPTIMEFIQWFNDTSTRNKRSSELAVLLQELEGSFFNAHVAAEMEQRLPHCGFFIVYDAMFVHERYVDVALAYCRMISQKLYRIQFTFTAEPIG